MMATYDFTGLVVAHGLVSGSVGGAGGGGMGAEYQFAPGAALPGLRCKRRTEARAMLVTL
jgi:hypothetical protein